VFDDNIFVIQPDGSLIELSQRRYGSAGRLQRLLGDPSRTGE
jgi:hypothetical protein